MGLVLQPITVVDDKGVRTEPGSVVKDYTAPDGRKCRSVKVCSHYSTSIADAWAVVGRFPNAFIQIWRRYDLKAWCVVISYEGAELRYAGEAETVPHAICLAALKAVQR